MNQLPAQFAELEPFVAFWAAETTSARHERRTSSSGAERQAFYDAVAPRLDEIVIYLNKQPLADIAGADLVLLRLALAAVQVSLAVDVIGRKEPEHSQSARRLKLGREIDAI
ncbi:MAG TPA: hypothetical protein VJR87_12790 [Allosphingosinicella sp.]|nr:hypothetical protein [Allosphingosinicella sp.]